MEQMISEFREATLSGSLVQRLPGLGNSLEAHWVGLSAFTAGTQAQSLVGELRSHKSQNQTKENKTETEQNDKVVKTDFQ